MTSLSTGAESTLFGILILAACLWIGGMVTVVFVARISSATLDPMARVAFFRAFGRAFGVFATVDLLVGLIVGAVLLGTAPWTGMSTALATIAAALVVGLAAGIVQARNMTRLRRRAEESGGALDGHVARGGRSAAALRGTISLLTLALFAVGLAHWL
ncbi:hypothetical protein [Tomitella fengzijianii]|uniref:DUF4149 domain-containing protein n=1 Tax=Tomitella fengzijianii TaxID=2597660 RepID=A0A516WZ77_9ACTN|nr:hypothetical protein [Tomitella fengzijianii]QDQ96139.1 hypothetical protein FO059_00735 [Tomitella fengzijianii]